MSASQELTRNRDGFGQAGAEGFASVVYRSQAVAALSPHDLVQLTLTSQRRNRREAVTGVMLYDNRHFFQWLEGPHDSVDRIMGSIRQDRRHTDIEILETRTIQRRAFGDWSMKLAAQGTKAELWRHAVIEPPPEIVETIRRQPRAAPKVLMKLVEVTPPARLAGSASGAADLQARTREVLRDVLLSTVIPRLGERYLGARAGRGGGGRKLIHARADELADLLVAEDEAAALALLGQLLGDGETLPLFGDLLEPAARILGDRLQNGECSEMDVSLGLVRLQSAVQLLGRRDLPLRGPGALPMVLIAPEPGEMHRLGAALDCDVLKHAGWAPRIEYPESDQALQSLLGGTWFDALDLSLSTAMLREDRVPDLIETISEARRASLNPSIVVVVGGRVFVELQSTALSVGADLAVMSSCGVDRLILSMLPGRGKRTIN